MSSNYLCEYELQEIARDLHRKARELEEAAEILRVLRSSDETEKQIEEAKKTAKQWLARYLEDHV